jgi:hypothetical protein
MNNKLTFEEYFDKYIYKNKESFSKILEQSLLIPYIPGFDLDKHLEELNKEPDKE